MVMRGKHRFRAELTLVGAVFKHRAGNGHAVEGGRAAADLIKDEQRRARGVPEYVRHLVHLDHEGGLSGGEVVGRADARENAVDDAYGSAPRRDKRTHLRHEDDKRRLTHIGGFTCHIGACDYRNAVVRVVEIGVVRNKEHVLHALLDHRVAALLYVQLARGIDLRHGVVVSDGGLRQRAQHVQPGHGVRRGLYPVHLGRDAAAYLGKEIVFQLVYPVARSKERVFKLLELLREVALIGHERLFSYIVIGYVRLARGFRHVDIIAEHLVVADLELLYPGALPLPLLKS